MKESKLKQLEQVSIGTSTETSMSNKYKILLLDAILTLDCRCDNVHYFYLLHQHFFQNKKLGFCLENNCEKVFRMSDRSKNDLFVSFGHENSLLSFFINIILTILRFKYFPPCMILGYYLITLSKNSK